ncbi:short-chain dehydrogenase/reductase [Streptomyces mashuensis]|uniref:Short-chain dehydrogenase/reductase n=1 Tax=Streptomyces mashuensis TaxID=33904 RepID=A0A919B4L2_9ACTN|nr:SDR family NAD(P)-dependent oxidoreductase [Streptomyces mashuensis]GHF45730.1 short-chain dehydrogenase/reductase [Streptomyces mashuensis]
MPTPVPLSWIVTSTSSGSSAGLGRHLTEMLLARGDRLHTAELDVTAGPAVRRAVDEAFAALGRADIVVCDAGHALPVTTGDLTDEQIARLVVTDLLGPVRVARAALHHLRVQGGGHIVQIAGAWELEGFFDALADEAAPYGIGTTLVRTTLAGGTLRPVADPAKTARAIIDCAALDPAPRRLTLGSDAYEAELAALTARLAELEAQRELAYAADTDDVRH